MENIQVITETIFQEAQKSAEDIIKEAKKIAEDIFEKQRQEGAQRGNEAAWLLIKKAEKEAELSKQHCIATAKVNSDWIILSRKQVWIDRVLNEVKSKLEVLTNSKEYLPILEKLIIEAGVILGGKELEVLLNEHDSTLPLKLDDIAKEISKKTGFKTKMRLSKEKIKTIGGAIVRTSNGRIIMDNTFEDIFVRKEKELRSKIAEILFK
ncbi:MAG: V-type ATP synthase subunit E family protein [Candidatus Bathyarchaeia archaeon]